MTDFGAKATIPDNDARKYYNPLMDGISFTSGRSALKAQLGQDPKHVDFTEYTFTSNPGDGNHVLLTIPHGYDYKPLAWVMGTRNDSDFFILQPTWVLALSFPIYLQDVTYTVTDTNLVITLRVSGSASAPSLNGVTLGFKYYLFTESVAV